MPFITDLLLGQYRLSVWCGTLTCQNKSLSTKCCTWRCMSGSVRTAVWINCFTFSNTCRSVAKTTVHICKFTSVSHCCTTMYSSYGITVDTDVNGKLCTILNEQAPLPFPEMRVWDNAIASGGILELKFQSLCSSVMNRHTANTMNWVVEISMHMHCHQHTT